MDFLRLALFLVLIASVAPRAVAYPDDLAVDSFTDAHPNGKGIEEKKDETLEDAKVAAANPAVAAAELPARESCLVDAKPQEKPEDFLCDSAREYIRALKFMRKNDVMMVPEEAARKIADRVSKACDGGADRFAKVLVMLKTVGLSDAAAMELALDFSSRPPDTQKNFIEIFTHAFLSEFFDYDYRAAVQLAFELSRDYRGDPKQVREDFIELTRFCKDGTKLDLPSRLCAEVAIRVARLSQFYPRGVREPFHRLYTKFREDKAFGVDIRTALELSYRILKGGPRAVDNFMVGYEFAISESGLALGQDAAVDFGLKMAGRSFRGTEPPLFASPALRMPANARAR